MTRIPFINLKNGGFYKISSRNLSYGVFVAERKSFIGIREKFGNRYLDEEFDWETGPPFGTAIPKEFIKDCSIRPLVCGFFIEDSYRNHTRLFDWIESQ